jgi:hypothetical protein
VKRPRLNPTTGLPTGKFDYDYEYDETGDGLPSADRIAGFDWKSLGHASSAPKGGGGGAGHAAVADSTDGRDGGGGSKERKRSPRRGKKRRRKSPTVPAISPGSSASKSNPLAPSTDASGFPGRTARSASPLSGSGAHGSLPTAGSLPPAGSSVRVPHRAGTFFLTTSEQIVLVIPRRSATPLALVRPPFWMRGHEPHKRPKSALHAYALPTPEIVLDMEACLRHIESGNEQLIPLLRWFGNEQRLRTIYDEAIRRHRKQVYEPLVRPPATVISLAVPPPADVAPRGIQLLANKQDEVIARQHAYPRTAEPPSLIVKLSTEQPAARKPITPVAWESAMEWAPLPPSEPVGTFGPITGRGFSIKRRTQAHTAEEAPEQGRRHQLPDPEGIVPIPPLRTPREAAPAAAAPGSSPRRGARRQSRNVAKPPVTDISGALHVTRLPALELPRTPRRGSQAQIPSLLPPLAPEAHAE